MDTIVALATPPGRSAIGIVRMSGPNSLCITRTLIGEEKFDPEPAHAILKSILDLSTAQLIDKALITYFKSPNSFTSEDIVEISSHGSPVVLRGIVDSILKLDARLAGPGEFTLRALKNGKINLSEAEAIRDLINAQTDAAARQAVRQLNGELSNRLRPLKDQLVAVIVPLESALEFVEDDLPALQTERLDSDLSNLIGNIGRLASTFNSGHLLRSGLKVAIAGPPNAGKSSLFNQLLRCERAIVTEVPGTTRDTLSEQIILGGVPITLTDTAGIREAGDRIEKLGVERAQWAMADANLVLIVLDGSTDLSDEVVNLLKGSNEHCVIALNKSDLPSYNNRLLAHFNGHSRAVQVSAKTGTGLEDLCDAIVATFNLDDANDNGLLVTDARHYDLLCRCQAELESAKTLFEKRASEELILVGLHNALRFLGAITGETTTETILSEIFSTFCIGK
jgi:tRNA modification GTPase